MIYVLNPRVNLLLFGMVFCQIRFTTCKKVLLDDIFAGHAPIPVGDTYQQPVQWGGIRVLFMSQTQWFH